MEAVELLVINDKILILPKEFESKSRIIIPDGVSKNGEEVKGGYVKKIGQGYPIIGNTVNEDKPWDSSSTKISTNWIPLLVRPGDYVYYLGHKSVMINYEGIKYVVAPESSVALILRGMVGEDINFTEE